MQAKSKKAITSLLLDTTEARENFSFRVTVDRIETYKELAARYKELTKKSIKLGEIGDHLMDEMNELLRAAVEGLENRNDSKTDLKNNQSKLRVEVQKELPLEEGKATKAE